MLLEWGNKFGIECGWRRVERECGLCADGEYTASSGSSCFCALPAHKTIWHQRWRGNRALEESFTNFFFRGMRGTRQAPGEEILREKTKVFVCVLINANPLNCWGSSNDFCFTVDGISSKLMRQNRVYGQHQQKKNSFRVACQCPIAR